MKNGEKNKVRKYIRNIMMLVCIAMLAGILLPGVHTQAASKKTKALKAYTAFLKKHPSKLKEIEKNGYYDASFSLSDTSYIDEFFLYDMDKSGVPELVTYTYVNFRWYIVRIYAWENGKVSLCKFSDGTDAVFNNSSVANGSYAFFICKKGHIHNEYAGGMASSENVYKFSKNKLKELFTCDRNSMTDTVTATKNGKAISAEKYESYTKGCSTKKSPTYYENTKSNRSKLKKSKCKIAK